MRIGSCQLAQVYFHNWLQETLDLLEECRGSSPEHPLIPETDICWCEEHKVLIESSVFLSNGDAQSACSVLEQHLESGGLRTESVVINLLGAYLEVPPLETFVDDVLADLMEGDAVNPAIAENLALLLMDMGRFADVVSVYDVLAMSGFSLQFEDLVDYATAALQVGDPGVCRRVGDFIVFEVMRQQLRLRHAPSLQDCLKRLRSAGARGRSGKGSK
jgi:hypothetical protein